MDKNSPLMTKVNGFVAEIMAMEGVLACAIVSNDGQIIGKSDSSQAPSPFLGITGATMFASAEAACSTFHISAPGTIIMEARDEDGIILIKNAGSKNLIATIITNTVNISEIREKITVISDNLAEEL
ncbi:MAG: roadblock/LC7 domain-containing protein [Methanomicrobiaceae archaeon]|nr:roadblock/LC7 domain-containing protein [Methanomicrobiaceae archaeon]